MTDPLALVEQRFRATLLRLGWGDIDPVVRPSDRADAQVNVALALGRTLGRPAPELAAELIDVVDLDDVADTLAVAGPGFVNVTFRDDFLVGCLQADASPPARIRERVVIDYSAPNVAKEMHVGHLRSTVIGDALARVFEHAGHEVIRQNHLGDWGTPFGMLVEHLLDVTAGAEGQGAAPLTVGDLNAFYREARAAFDTDPVFAARSRARVVALQAGDPETIARWQQLVEESRRHFGAVYDALGVTLTAADDRGESAYNDLLPAVVDDLRAGGWLLEDGGAECVFPPDFTARDGSPLPLIVRKQDGGYGYAATDLAALRFRVDSLAATRLLYVVGAPQQAHLAMVFAVARQAGWLPPTVTVEHVAFGSVLGEDGRIFRTRGGETVRLTDLLDEAIARATVVIATKNPALGAERRDEVARAVGIGAVKYADLANDRIKDYVFDLDRMLSLHGNTAPYLQYAHARICSIFRKAGLDPTDPPTDPDAIIITDPRERDLVVRLLAFDRTVDDVVASLRPHRLCTTLFDLAQTFTTFYEACPVLSAGEPVRSSRLALCGRTALTLRTGLDLLGIDAPPEI